MTLFKIILLCLIGIGLILLVITSIFLYKKLKPILNKFEKNLDTELEKSKKLDSINSTIQSMIQNANERVRLAENKVSGLEKIASDSKKEAREFKKERDNFVRIIKDDRVLYPKHSLQWGGGTNAEKFTVDYECEVLEVSEKMAKVKPYAVTSTNNKFNELSLDGQKNIFKHINDKWVPLSSLQLIIDIGRP